MIKHRIETREYWNYFVKIASGYSLSLSFSFSPHPLLSHAHKFTHMHGWQWKIHFWLRIMGKCIWKTLTWIIFIKKAPCNQHIKLPSNNPWGFLKLLNDSKDIWILLHVFSDSCLASKPLASWYCFLSPAGANADVLLALDYSAHCPAYSLPQIFNRLAFLFSKSYPLFKTQVKFCLLYKSSRLDLT